MSVATVAVRRGGAGDRAFVRDLGRRTAQTSVSSIRGADPGDVVIAYDRLLDFVDDHEHELLVAELGGRRAGFVLMVYDIPDDVSLGAQAFIAYTAVEPDLRRAGIGRALLDEAERLARAAGRAFVSLMVTEDNAAARALYDGAGYATERRMMTKRL